MHFPIEFKAIDALDWQDAYAGYKSALIHVIESTFGWNESFQQKRFLSHYQLNWFQWIEVANERVGFICFFEKASEIHLSLLIIDSENRDRGLGRLAMRHLHTIARSRDCTVTLSSFRKNTRAIKFYERLGYVATGGDEHFIDMTLATP